MHLYLFSAFPIAVSNNIDSSDQSSSEIAPFLNVINDFYLRDCSHKQKQAYKARGNAGIPYASIPCYGYRKDPNDKHKRIVDEEAAAVVREIFSMAVKGYGPKEIAVTLQKRRIEKPSYYMATHGIWKCPDRFNADRSYDWNLRTVADILARVEYLGHTVNGRSTSESYKTHKRIRIDPSEWQIIENSMIRCGVHCEKESFCQKRKEIPQFRKVGCKVFYLFFIL